MRKKVNLGYLKMIDLNNFDGLISFIMLSNVSDTWKFNLLGDGKFYVKDMCSLINSKATKPIYKPTTWIYLVPSKVTCFCVEGMS